MSYSPRRSPARGQMVGSFLTYLEAVRSPSVESGATPSQPVVIQYVILQWLAVGGSPNLRDVQIEMALDFRSFSAAINELERAGLIALHGAPSGETVTLTQTGKALAESILSSTARWRAQRDGPGRLSEAASSSRPPDWQTAGTTGTAGSGVVTRAQAADSEVIAVPAGAATSAEAATPVVATAPAEDRKSNTAAATAAGSEAAAQTGAPLSRPE